VEEIIPHDFQEVPSCLHNYMISGENREEADRQVPELLHVFHVYDECDDVLTPLIDYEDQLSF